MTKKFNQISSSTWFVGTAWVATVVTSGVLMLATSWLLLHETSVTFGAGILGPLLGAFAGLALRRLEAVLTLATIGGLADVTYGVIAEGSSTTNPREVLMAILVASVAVGAASWVVPAARRGPWREVALSTVAIMASNLAIATTVILLQPGSSPTLSPDPNRALVGETASRNVLYAIATLTSVGIALPAVIRLGLIWHRHRAEVRYALDVFMFAGATLLAYGIGQSIAYPHGEPSDATALTAFVVAAGLAVAWDVLAHAAQKRFRPAGPLVFIVVAIGGSGLLLLTDRPFRLSHVPGFLLCLAVAVGVGWSSGRRWARLPR